MIKFIKHIFNYWKKPVHRSEWELQHCYTQEIDGKEVKYYSFKNPLSIPVARKFQANVVHKWAQQRMDDKTLMKMLEVAKENLDKGKTVDAGTVLNEILFRVESTGDKKLLLDLACCYIVREDEKPEKMLQSIQDEKVKDWENDMEAMGFFLEYAMTLTGDYSVDSQDTFQNYLEAILLEAKRNLKSSTARAAHSMK